jgi:hypothetical protein
MDSLNTNLISESQFSEKYNRNLKFTWKK